MNAADKPIIDVDAKDARDPSPSDEPDAETLDTDTLADLRDRASERIELARTWIRHNPLPALGIALAAGFVVGRMMRR